MSDNLNNLPTDNTPIKSEEIEFFESVFKDEKIQKQFLKHNRDVLIAGIIFFIFFLPSVQKNLSNIIQRFSGCNNSYFIYFILTLIFMLIFFFIKNISLSIKN